MPPDGCRLAETHLPAANPIVKQVALRIEQPASPLIDDNLSAEDGHR